MIDSEQTWAVIGAGPAGLATIGKLLEKNIAHKNIFWIDPAFLVGDFGTKWRNIPSNTKVKFFQQFLLSCDAFDIKTIQDNCELFNLDPEKTCQLKYMADALQWVSDLLYDQVNAIRSEVTSITQRQRQWCLHYDDQELIVDKVVLAVGSEPKTLSHTGVQTLSLATAMDDDLLKKECNADDVIGVFGSSHSAILAVRHLIESCTFNKVINFYRTPLRYALEMDGWILNDNTGLKGTTAQWARTELQQFIPTKIERILANDQNIEHHLPRCNKVIYAVGFERRNTVVVDDLGHLDYCAKTGIIAPGLFGAGIAFPERVENPYGMVEHSVGLWKFINYLNRVVPLWIRYG